jgi:rod shape-determining protein MreC
MRSTRSADLNPLFTEATGTTVKLVIFGFIAIGLMIADHRGDYLVKVRATISAILYPIERLAQVPRFIGEQLSLSVVEQRTLKAENDALRGQLLLGQAQVAQFQSLKAENERLRSLLGARKSLDVRGQLAEITDIDLDPFNHRVTVNLGSASGVEAGQVLIDDQGVMGQIDRVGPLNATAILLSDPNAAIPVEIVRSGGRGIAFGSGDPQVLRLKNLRPGSARNGDLLVSSGLGGRFPPGFPVAVVSAVRGDPISGLEVADARPVAALDRSLKVLLLNSERAPVAIGSQ